MPVNLPPQYHQKEAELKTAKTLEEKISVLEELLAIMPKHKSSEKLQALLKTKIAKYKKLIEKGPHVAKRTAVPAVKREGAGQVALCGPANSGKSTILSVITKAKPDIADYPFTTKMPVPGMLRYCDINIQLVDTPPLSVR
ncbi:MAG: 50S ribosome-binding GTPase [Candidatus Omnitrophica bacterium]|nr:50S ribosome-binding GTPase [Candidatus Omnitrophota bacterium]